MSQRQKRDLVFVALLCVVVGPFVSFVMHRSGSWIVTVGAALVAGALLRVVTSALLRSTDRR